MSLGEVIRLSRQKALCTQEDYAKKLEVAISTVNRWELNKSRPNIKAMKAIKSFCDENNLDYSLIENEWLDYSAEKK